MVSATYCIIAGFVREQACLRLSGSEGLTFVFGSKTRTLAQAQLAIQCFWCCSEVAPNRQREQYCLRRHLSVRSPGPQICNDVQFSQTRPNPDFDCGLPHAF